MNRVCGCLSGFSLLMAGLGVVGLGMGAMSMAVLH